MPIGPLKKMLSRGTVSSRRGGGDESFESLERRVMLSGTDPVSSLGSLVDVDWLGQTVQAERGSFVLSFSERFEPGEAQSRALQAAGALGLSVEEVQSIGLGYNALIKTRDAVSDDAAASLVQGLDWLTGFVPDIVQFPQAEPNDPLFDQQWQLSNTGLPIGGVQGVVGADANLTEAWESTIGSRDAIVAVIDTGVDLDHPDLADNIWVNPGEIPGNGIDDDGNGFVDDVNGFDFANLDSDPNPGPVGTGARGHGTQVAGVIGAVGNNGIGVAGVAWNVSVMALRASNDAGGLPLSATVGAIDYVTMMRNRGVNIVAANASYGAIAGFELAQFRQAEKDAIGRLIDSGAVFVAAAGNDGINIDPIPEDERTQFPAGFDLPGIVSVAATDNTDQLTAFSNFGVQNVDLAAPGQFILTTDVGGGFTSVSGTSFSAPMVSGAVALLKTIRPGASAEEIRQVLKDSADPLPSLQNRVQSAGRLNVAEAIRQLTIDGPTVTEFLPGPVTGQLGSDGSPVDTLTVSFSRVLDQSVLNTGFVELIGAGADGVFETGDDVAVPIDSLTATEPDTVEVGLDLFSFPQTRLPVDSYRLTLNAAGFVDEDGNLLNGDSQGGSDEQIAFDVVGAIGLVEPNDTLGTAEVLPTFSGSGQATLTGLQIGDGVQAGLDVDLFAINIPRGGQIRAEVIAQNRPGGSSLDSFLRLFDNAGNELTANDQFNGQDALVDFFVPTGGTYFVGVSGFPNTSYDPTVTGSGVPQSGGIYDLSIGVELIQEDRVTVSRDLSGNPLRIPAVGSLGVTVDQLSFSDARQILDLNVTVDLTHDFTGDLEISLISPRGTQVLLFDQRGGNGDDLTGTLFDDEATQTIASGTAPFAGQFRPDQALSDFDGESAAGVWTLLINDRSALNTGALLGWSIDFTLENNIFGPFESNDTIQTATMLDAIDGTGSTTVQASIGDGGFGGLDRDLFRFEAGAGTTLRAELTSGGTLNGALRLFDDQGNQLLASNPTGTINASIDDFVLIEGGTFFIGVSDGANIAYDPSQVGSGVASVTTGAFSLNVVVTPGVSDQAATLVGSDLGVGVAADGTFLSSNGQSGLNFNGIEFLFGPEGPQSGTQFFGAAANGFTFKNDGPGGESGLPVALTNQTDAINRRVLAQGTFQGLSLERAVTFAGDDSFAVIDIRLSNTTASTVAGLTFMEALNAEQGLNTSPGTTAATVNDINAAGTLLTSAFTNTVFPAGLTVGLAHARAERFTAGGSVAGTFDPVATFFDPQSLVVRDAGQLLATVPFDPNGAQGDLAMGLAYDLGNLAVGESVELRYFLLFGDDAGVQNLFTQLDSGTGTGHLAADPANPATETLQTAADDPDDQAPTLPFRAFFPEGFANSKTSTFVPIANPNDRPTRVVAIARFETGARDRILGDFEIEANARGGLTITTPNLFASGESLVRPLTPFSVEVRSELPVAASFSHFDEFLIVGGQAGIGESFINRPSETWTFGEVVKGPGIRDFLLLQNTTDQAAKVTFTFFNQTGQTFESTIDVDAQRRAGIDVQNVVLEGGGSLPAGTYGVRVESEGEIVASLSHFNTTTSGAFASAGVMGIGSLRGVSPEGQLGLRATEERLGVLNVNPVPADVVLSFVFANGSTFRTSVEVPAQSRAGVDIDALPNFPVGQAYAVSFESDVPVSMTLPTTALGDEFASGFADEAFTLWSFGEGFRPANGVTVDEYLRLFNPSTDDSLVEITLRFDEGLGQETFRRTVPAGRVSEFDLFDFVTGDERRSQKVFFSITIKASDPIVAYMGHFDQFFPGGFGTLGTPLGAPTPL